MLDAKYVNRLLHCDCVAGMQELPDECIPLTVTSPPYDDMREYGGHLFDFEAIAQQLYRVTMPGGVVVWVVRDAVVSRGESGTSFRQALRFQELGFLLYETIIMDRTGYYYGNNPRYGGSPEYAFVLSKGKPMTLNFITDRRNKNVGARQRCHRRRKDGGIDKCGLSKPIGMWGRRGRVWVYSVGFNQTTKDKAAYRHSALMPEAMAEDLIVSFSLPGDLVFDPFSGAGTTAKMALLNCRRYLGMEIHEPYHDTALQRIQVAQAELARRLDKSLGIHLTQKANRAAFRCERIELPERHEGNQK